jgi:hypothetical protein
VYYTLFFSKWLSILKLIQQQLHLGGCRWKDLPRGRVANSRGRKNIAEGETLPVARFFQN